MIRNNIGFTSKINFVDLPTFRALPLSDLEKSGKSVDKPWTSDEIIKSDEGFTNSIQDCSAGGITNGKVVTMFHLLPSDENIDKFETTKNILLPEANGEKDKSLNGLIIGGRCNFYANCTKLFEKMKGFFEDNKLDHSVIWGQSIDGYSNIHYATKDDTWTVNASSDCSDVTDLKSLQEAFDTIRISDRDQLLINGKEIPREELEKAGMAK